MLFLTVLCGHVLADEEYTFGGKGVFDYVKDYFEKDEVDAVPVPDVSVIQAPEEASPGVALMSVSPEDIANGVLVFTYSSNLDAYDDYTVGYTSVTSSSAMNSVRTVSLGTELEDDQPTTYTDTIYITSNDVIVDKGEIFDFSLTGITNWWDYTKITNSGQANANCLCDDASKIDVSLYFTYKNTGRQKVDPAELVFTVSGGKYFYISVSIEEPLDNDLLGIDIVMKYDVQDAFGMPADAARGQSTQYASFNPHHTVGFYNSEFVLSIIDQTNGLLGGIIDWLKGIWEGITSLPGKIVDGIKNLMISLFVPSDSFFEECFDRFDYVFKDRLGFMYTALSYIIDLYYNLIDYWTDSGYEQEFIEFPEVSIPVSDDVDFVFGGWSVKVIPEGFEDIVQMLKNVVNMICTVFMIITSWRYFEKFIDGGARS